MQNTGDRLSIAKFKLNYRKLSSEQKLQLLEKLREKLEGVAEIMFAYVYGGFVKRNFFRDLDGAVWLKNPRKAFFYTMVFSAKLEIELGFPIDLQVLNEAPQPFQFNVCTQGKVLFSKDESFRVMLVDEVIRKHNDLKFLVRTTKLSFFCCNRNG